jgi:hypothetical protein
MKTTVQLHVKLFLATAIIVACKSQEKAPEAQAGWTGPMQHMALDVKKLVPYIYDREAYINPKNHEEILKDLRDLSQAAHHVSPEAGKPFLGDDLLIQYSLKNLKDDLNRAAFSFQVGQKDFSRMTAKASLNHCFRCHSVSNAGGTTMWDLDFSNLQLAPLEKADLLVATRKNDQAMAFMEQLLNSGDMQKTYAFDFESMLRRYLALMIRVENAPARALAQMNKVLSNPDTPHYIAEQGRGWQRSLKAWAAEKKQPPFNSPGQLFKAVTARFEKAEAIQHYEKDHGGDVEYLRATAMLHQGMKLLKKPADQVRALFLLGKAYEVLDELGSWNLHESYYEACLVKDPKSALARNCYNRLEASLFMGYSGTSGTHIPPEERSRLQKLKQMMQ